MAQCVDSKAGVWSVPLPLSPFLLGKGPNPHLNPRQAGASLPKRLFFFSFFLEKETKRKKKSTDVEKRSRGRRALWSRWGPLAALEAGVPGRPYLPSPARL